MSRGTESDICKNVINIGSCTAIYDRLEYIYEEEDNYQSTKPELMHGWHLVGEAVSAGTNGRLYAMILAKGDFKVSMVNTDFYEHVGEYDYDVFSDNLTDVKEFLNDFIDEDFYSRKISPMDSVQQTL
jgi:hypothetical protein